MQISLRDLYILGITNKQFCYELFFKTVLEKLWSRELNFKQF